MKRPKNGNPVKIDSRIEIGLHIVREIRRHAQSSMSAEICGVLIGKVDGKTTVIEACIAGENAAQGGSHVTFTQDTWTHIYNIKDKKYPDDRIVGWYHSHPGFGIFLSEHDTFIHKNFFSDPSQVAWVYDPHSDEEGCFAWKSGEIVRVPEIVLRDDPGADIGSPKKESSKKESKKKERAAETAEAHDEKSPWPDEPPRSGSRAARVIGLTLSHLAAIVLGFILCWLLITQVLLAPRAYQPPHSQAPRLPAPQATPRAPAVTSTEGSTA